MQFQSGSSLVAVIPHGTSKWNKHRNRQRQAQSWNLGYQTVTSDIQVSYKQVLLCVSKNTSDVDV
jgi:hypothetical protein